jgi:16S rRNA processing protein RimM
MGRIAAPFGVKGWVKVEAYTAARKGLLEYPVWWLEHDAIWQERRVEEARVQGNVVVAKLERCEDRDEAARLKGASVAVPREALPPAGADEFYWADLIGLRVTNEHTDDFGVITRILETGANDVLVVEGERERLIPFIAQVVKRVDLAAGVIVVDWDATY